MKKTANPVIRGFNPDPSIVRVKDTYYIATSTFEWYPGVTIYSSKNLSDWEFAAAPLTEKHMDLRGIDSACGIWAPNLTWCDGKFYLLYTIVYTNRARYKDTHNFLTTAENIEGPWSAPVYLNCSGFDPSIFHDDNGRKWIVNMTIDHRPDRVRFSGIDIQEYDIQKNCVTGPVHRIFRGTEIQTTEGPNIMKKDGWYYLTCAEGGTEFGHCVTVARAKEITGPYEVDPENPMMSSKAAADYPIQRAGHGQLVEDGCGNWYMSHLCSRPVNGFSILGRETAIQNIIWTEDGWYRLAEGGKLPGQEYATPDESADDLTARRNAHPTGREDFDGNEIPWQFLTLRESAGKCGISIQEREGWLRIRGGNSLTSKYRQGFLARRVQDFACTCTVKMEFEPRRYQHMAGLACYYNYDNYHYLRVTHDEELGVCICVTTAENRDIRESEYVALPDAKGIFYLRAEVNYDKFYFSYSLDGEHFVPIGGELDMTIISDEHVNGNGFTGAMIGMCCQDLQGDGCYADFDWFEYRTVE